jgi:hypothetical protein
MRVFRFGMKDFAIWANCPKAVCRRVDGPGVSSPQIDNPDRGFSFRLTAPRHAHGHHAWVRAWPSGSKRCSRLRR